MKMYEILVRHVDGPAMFSKLNPEEADDVRVLALMKLLTIEDETDYGGKTRLTEAGRLKLCQMLGVVVSNLVARQETSAIKSSTSNAIRQREYRDRRRAKQFRVNQ
jgi:hypothetical protein